MRRKFAVAAVLGILISASGETAQEQQERRQEISTQGAGVFTRDSSGNGINQHATDTGGFLLSYRYHLNRWFAADATYGYARNTQQNVTSTGALNVQANVHQATGILVVTMPHRIVKLTPYLLAGAGALILDPTGNSGGFISGATSQAKPAFV